MILADINVEAGQKIVSENAENLVFQKLDVTSAADWKAVMDTAFSKFGRLDILVNNAGTSYKNKVFDETRREMARSRGGCC